MPANAINALVKALPTLDLGDWQGLVSLQKLWGALADAAETSGDATLSSAALTAVQSLDSLFGEDLTPARAALIRSEQEAMLGFLTELQASSAPSAPANALVSNPASNPVNVHVNSGPAVDPALGQAVVLGPGADSAMLAEFATEAGEHLQTIEANLLSIESGQDPEAMNACFRAFHTVKGLAGFIGLDREKRLAHAAESLLDQIRSGRLGPERNTMDLLLQSRDVLLSLITVAASAGPGVALPAEPRLPGLIEALQRATVGNPVIPPSVGEILVGTGRITRNQLEQALITQSEVHPDRKLGEVLVAEGTVSPEELGQALALQKSTRTPPPPGTSPSPGPGTSPAMSGQATLASQAAPVSHAPPAAAPASMRVDVQTVDRLADTIGELVIANTMLFHSEELRNLGSRRIQRLLGALDRVTRQVQSMAQRLRLVSLKPTFQRMTRLVRDLERSTGKKVELVTEGEDVDLDKSVVDRLADPMVHLIRNALDHGLEPEAERLAKGKSPQGRLRIAAERRAGAIHIIIEEDGRGLGRERILKKALERGLIPAGSELTDEQVWDLIYLPGFSTAEQVTDLSGRGVGMDVVRRMVADSRGRIITHSAHNQGTRFTLVLPLTLAIIDGMVVAAGEQRYIVPTLSVVLATRLDADHVTEVHGGRGRLAGLLNRQIPIFSLTRLLGLPTTDSPRPLIVVVQDGSQEIGLVVDAVIGRQQVVLKHLGQGLPPAQGISGATITGSGQVCLVLDIAGLVQSATLPPSQRTGTSS